MSSLPPSQPLVLGPELASHQVSPGLHRELRGRWGCSGSKEPSHVPGKGSRPLFRGPGPHGPMHSLISSVTLCYGQGGWVGVRYQACLPRAGGFSCSCQMGGGRRSGRRRSSVAAGAGGVRAGAQVPEDSLNSLFLCSEPRNGPQKALSTLGPGAQAGSPPVHPGSSGSFRGPAGQSRETGRPHSLPRGWEGRKEARG